MNARVLQICSYSDCTCDFILPFLPLDESDIPNQKMALFQNFKNFFSNETERSIPNETKRSLQMKQKGQHFFPKSSF